MIQTGLRLGDDLESRGRIEIPPDAKSIAGPCYGAISEAKNRVAVVM